MDKSVDAFRSIGEVAAELNIRTHILRYWEEQFPVLRPLTRAGGRRHYRPEDVVLVKTIHRLLNQEGYTIKGARQYLANGGSVNVAGAAVVRAPVAGGPATNAGPAIDMLALRAVRDRLAQALAVA